MSKNFSSELLKGSVKHIILSVLSNEDMYGYDIIKAIEAKSGAVIVLGEGNVYPALHELEKKGYLSSYWVKQKTGPDRKYYHVTRKGKKELDKGLKSWLVFSRALQSIYAK